MDRGASARLGGMMAGVWAVQGAWWPLLAVHLTDVGVPARDQGWIFGTMALASLVTPLAAGLLADRFVPAQRLLALVYALGTAWLAALAAGVVSGPRPLFLMFLSYWLLTAAGPGLAAAIALRNLAAPAAQFGRVRLWGTVGWMASGWLVWGVMATRADRATRGVPEAFAVAAVLSAVYALYCLTLPHTPPLRRRRADRGAAPAAAPRPAVLLALAMGFAASLSTPFVYQVVPSYLNRLGLPRPWIAPAMSLGQVLEVAALAVLPVILRRLGFRTTMALGLASWIGFHGLMMAGGGRLGLALAALPLQGVAIALFHITMPMYLDALAPADRRAGTQGLYVMATSGLGNLVGSVLAGELVARAGGASAPVFLAPMGIAGLVLVLLLAAFRPARAAAPPPHHAPAHPRGAAAPQPAHLDPDPGRAH